VQAGSAGKSEGVMITICGCEYKIARSTVRYVIESDGEALRVDSIPYLDVVEAERVFSKFAPLQADGLQEKVNKEMSLKIETVSEIPDFTPRGKWIELFEAAEKMSVGQVIRLTAENRKEATSAQANLQGSHSAGRPKSTLREKGYKFVTRTQAVNGRKDGQWYVFIKRTA
jgi:hypothetical protein